LAYHNNDMPLVEDSSLHQAVAASCRPSESLNDVLVEVVIASLTPSCKCKSCEAAPSHSASDIHARDGFKKPDEVAMPDYQMTYHQLASDISEQLDGLERSLGLVKDGFRVAFGVLLETDRKVKGVLGIKTRSPCI
jgi:hypothetical protein